MKTYESREFFSHLLPQAFGVSAAGIGLITLLGWILDLPLLASFHARLKPMAPSSAILFLLLGATLFFRNRFPENREVNLTGIVIGSISAITSLLLFYFSSAGIHPQLEHFGFSFGETVDGMQIGHISPITAVCFVFVSLSFLATLFSSVERPRRAIVALIFASIAILISLVLMLAYFFGRPLLYGGEFIPPSLPTSLAILFLALGLLVTATLKVWPFNRVIESATARVSYVLAFIFVLLTSVIVVAGYSYYHHYETQYKTEIERQLSAIVNLKTGELVQWRKERLNDAAIYYANVDFSRLARQCLETPKNLEAQTILLTWLRHVREASQYDRLCLYDTQMVARTAYPKESGPTDSSFLHCASEVMHSRQIVFQDFYRDQHDDRVYLNILVPILDEQNANRVIGILAMRIDPEQNLYPLINQWPIPSRTAETLIIRRDGNDALVLNEVRFQKNTALALRIPLSRREVASVRAARGEEGIIESTDYRGVPVIACVRAIPNSPWFLVARIDMLEVFSPLQERLWTIVIFICTIIIGVGTSVGLVWRHQRASFYREKYEAAEALRQSEHKVSEALQFNAKILHTSSIGILTYKKSGQCASANVAAARVAGATVEQLLAQNFHEIPSWKKSGMYQAAIRALDTGIEQLLEIHFVNTFGKDLWLSLSFSSFDSGGERHLLVFTSDITERKQAEEALREVKEHLELRVQERTAKLEQANCALQTQIAERKAAEETVKRERQRLYDVLETLPAYVVLLSADYHVPFANRFFRQRFGESEGRRCYEYLFHRDAPCEICETYTVLKTAAPHTWEWAGPDGHNYDIFDFPFTDEGGALLILEMGIDITERKRAEETLRKTYNELEQRVADRTEKLRRANEELWTEITERKRIEVDLSSAHSRLRRLSHRFLQIQENERRAIARELHDEIGQILTATKINLEVIRRNESSNDLALRLDDSIAILDECLQKVRKLSLDLRPSILDDLGLVAALRWQLERLEHQVGFEGRLIAEGIQERFDPDLETACFRIAQEAITNIARHAKAHHLEIELKLCHEGLDLSIRDDGVGFDVDRALTEAIHGKSFGILGIQERVTLLNGKFEIKSTAGIGTIVSARFPLRLAGGQ